MQKGRHGEFGDFYSTNNDIIDEIRKRVFYHFFKYIFDKIFSTIAIILLIPVFVTTAIFIKIYDPRGPIFYSQVRVGKNGHLFKMYKFRSMVVDADKKLKRLLDYNEVEGAMFKMKDDPRVTRIGKIIRKYSIDELPQLLNVIRGDMSLVGPRPPLKREVKEYTEYDNQRLLVVPGCTGLWQVSERNSVGFHEMVKLDIKYIKNASILLDMQILFKTVKIMFIPNSAC